MADQPFSSPSETALTEPHWGAWKRHLIVCADCTAGDPCAEGRGILGSATPDNAPWLRGSAPVPVREERQDDRSLAKLNAMCEAVATVDDLVQARKLLSALCNGEFKRWRMCVPVQRDDSDIVLSRVILTAGRYVKLQSSLDALAVAVKETGFDPASERTFAVMELNDDHSFVILRESDAQRIRAAITALLSNRETTNG